MLLGKKTDKKKNICMIVPDPYVRGGIAAVTSGYYGSLLEEDYHMIYVQSYRDGNKWQKLIKAIGAYFRFAGIMLCKHIDLVHIHSSFGPSFYRKKPFIDMAYMMHVPIVNHIHGAEFNDFFVAVGKKKQSLIKRCYNKCSVLIALSDEWKDNLSRIVDSNKIVVIPNYSKLHPEALDRRADSSKDVKILFLGELGYRKGGYDIPEIAKELGGSVSNWEMILAGSGAPEDEDAIRNRVSELGLEKKISFPGWVRDEAKDMLLKEADIFFLPSYNEGMPMSILDACGYALPIVSSEVGGIPQVVCEENGILCKAGDIEGFARALSELVIDYERRTACGKASYELVQNKYSIDKHIYKIENIWNEILA